MANGNATPGSDRAHTFVRQPADVIVVFARLWFSTQLNLYACVCVYVLCLAACNTGKYYAHTRAHMTRE